MKQELGGKLFRYTSGGFILVAGPPIANAEAVEIHLVAVDEQEDGTMIVKSIHKEK